MSDFLVQAFLQTSLDPACKTWESRSKIGFQGFYDNAAVRIFVIVLKAIKYVLGVHSLFLISKIGSTPYFEQRKDHLHPQLHR